jgi:hypothetical protein
LAPANDDQVPRAHAAHQMMEAGCLPEQCIRRLATASVIAREAAIDRRTVPRWLTADTNAGTSVANVTIVLSDPDVSIVSGHWLSRRGGLAERPGQPARQP